MKINEIGLDREKNLVMLRNDMVTLKELLKEKDDESMKKTYMLMGIIWGRVLLMTNMYAEYISDQLEQEIDEFSDICRQVLNENKDEVK